MKNVSKLIERTLNYRESSLLPVGPSRVRFGRYVETFVGKMNNTRFKNILTGRELSKIELDKLEIEIIDFLTETAVDNNEDTVKELEEAIGDDLETLKVNEQIIEFLSGV